MPRLVRFIACAAAWLAFAGRSSWAAEPIDPGLAVLDVLRPSRAFVSGPVSAIARSTDGTLFVGSTRLAAFDGWAWRQIEVPGAKRIFALTEGLAENGREKIWVGGLGVLGYLEKVPGGDWSFHSLLMALTPDAFPETEEIRHIHSIHNGALFVAKASVLRWDGRTFARWNLPAPDRLHAFTIGNDLLVHQLGVGLLRFDATGPHVWQPQATLPSSAEMVAYASLSDGAELAVFPDEIFRRDGDRWLRLDAASTALRTKQATRAVAVAPDTIAVGTFLGGLMLLRADGTIKSIINTRTGLIDDNVHTLIADQSGALWIGMSRGIALLSAPGEAVLYDQRVGINIGVTRKVLLHDNRPYVLTSRSLFSLYPTVTTQPASWRGSDGAWTELWDAVSMDGSLWVAGSAGLWHVSPERAINAHPFKTDMLLLAAPRLLPHGLLLFENTSCQVWEHSLAGWSARDVPLALDGLPVSVIEDANDTVWVSTITGHITALRLEDAGTTLRVAGRYDLERGAPIPTARPLLSCVADNVVAFTEHEIVVHAPAAAGFTPLMGFENLTGVAAVTAMSADEAYWIVQNKELGAAGPYALVRVTRGDGAQNFQWTALAAPGLDQIGQVTSLNFIAGSEPSLWVGGTNGVLRIDTAALVPAAPAPQVTLQSVRADGAESPTAWAGGGPHFAPGVNRLEFMFPGGVAVPNGALFYQTRLEGAEREWSQPAGEPRREFTRLTAGAYAFTARAVDRFGRYGQPLRFEFTIEAPWYRRPLVLAVIAACIVLVTAIGVRLRLVQLHRQSEKLNRLVDERTRELSLSNAAKSDFLENISHEIRNPLQGVVGLVNLLEAERLESRPRDLSRALKACAQSLHRVFDDVLNFSRLEYGYITVQTRPFALQPMLEDVRAIFLSAALRAGSAITVQTPENWADGFEGDEAKIKTIVSNFVSNALKYAPGTSIAISVSIIPSTDDLGDAKDATQKVELLIEVSDGGAGVPPEEQELIFKKFARGANAKTLKAPGTGIGLAACRALAKLMGGSVGIESTPGLGATFFLQVALARAATGARVAGAERWSGGLMSALIVEDQSFNQIIVAEQLQSLGFEPVCVDNSEHALAAAAQKAFALVVVDLELPGSAGGEVAHQLRTLPGGATPVIVGTSAEQNEAITARCAAAGMDAFLAKPVTREQLRDTFADAMSRRTADKNGALDFSLLQLYARHVPGGLAEAVQTYRARLEQALAAVEEAFRADATHDALLAVHRLHSHASIVGAAQLSDAADALERALRAHQLPLTPKLLEDLSRETTRVAETLALHLSPDRQPVG